MKPSGDAQQGVNPKENSVWQEYAYHFLALAAVAVLAVGTIAYHYIEGWSWVDSFYFSAVAGSSVGFGDLTPTTDGAKLFTVLYIFSSIAILGTFLNERLKHHGVVRKRTEVKVSSSQSKNQK
jgi:hypothetical protein